MGQVVSLVADRIVAAPQRTAIDHHQQTVVAVVGPAGVGKTSLIGKMACQQRDDQPITMAMVSVDAWRQPSGETLLKWAEQAGADVELVGGPEQLSAALQRLREHDLVLIDTAGCSPSDSPMLQSIKEYLDLAQPDEVHLALPAGLSRSYICHSLESFKLLRPTHWALTKLDESVGAGQWLAPLWNSSMPVHYLSHGPGFQDNLSLANPRHLAAILLGQVNLKAGPLT
jgi:flagellar biosynthesis protein FlhF